MSGGKCAAHRPTYADALAGSPAAGDVARATRCRECGGWAVVHQPVATLSGDAYLRSYHRGYPARPRDQDGNE
jgi:hypothetical protein